MESLGDIERRIEDAIKMDYPANRIRFAADPDAHDIVSVELFDVPDAECREVKGRMWEIIDANCREDAAFAFIPVVFSHSKTIRFYPEYRSMPIRDEENENVDFDQPLPESIMAALVDCDDGWMESDEFADGSREIPPPMMPRKMIEQLANEERACDDDRSYRLAA